MCQVSQVNSRHQRQVSQIQSRHQRQVSQIKSRRKCQESQIKRKIKIQNRFQKLFSSLSITIFLLSVPQVVIRHFETYIKASFYVTIFQNNINISTKHQIKKTF